MGFLEAVQNLDWGTTMVAAAAATQAVFAVLLWNVNRSLHRETRAIRDANVALAHLQEEAARRDRTSFRVAPLRDNPFTSLRPGEHPQVEFDVYNDGHKDSAILHANVEVEQNKERVDGWTIDQIQRIGPGDPNDRMVRAGDYVRFRGRVRIPAGATLGGRDFVLAAVPVLDDGDGRGRTYFHRPGT